MVNLHALPLLDPLSERELHILRLMSEGLSNREIADTLVISFETVRWYTKQIYSKLGVHSRAQAIIRAADILEGETQEQRTLPIHTLPTYPLSFVGRKHELEEIAALLNDPGIRLVTITGLGGMGKTRLSVEAARLQLEHYPDGVYFIPLLKYDPADDLFSAIAQEMSLREMSKRQLLQHLRERRVLLVLDNFDHMVENARVPDELLESTERVKLLITSRSSLNLRKEWVYYVDGILYPDEDTDDDLERYSAVQLFVERVQRVRRGFSLGENREEVLELCRLVHGMPLALELASAWLKTMSCADVVHEIRRNLDFLTARERDIDERHRSIRAVFDYSWKLLSREEQRVLRRLSLFRGGFGAAAAEQIAGADLQLLSDLIDKSLLWQNERGVYEIHELLQQYLERQITTTTQEMMSTRSTMILAWLTLIKGDFDRVREIARQILETSSLKKNLYDEGFSLAFLGVLAGIDGDYTRCHQMCEASLNLISQSPVVRDPTISVFTYLGLAIANCGSGNYPNARRHLVSALQVASNLKVATYTTLCLPVAAIIRAHHTSPEDAAALLGCAFTHSARTWLQDWSILKHFSARLEDELGTEAYLAAWESGKTLDLEQIVPELIEGFSAG
jgi:predicted ATPase/DNA-binding CsgD family transcriptional regulator